VKRSSSSEQTLVSYRLPPALAGRVADLPEAYQAALARMVAEIGEAGLGCIIKALAPGGRGSDFLHRLPLLRQMAAEMVAQNPHLGGIGGNWRKGKSAAADKVANSPEGKAIGHSPPSTKKWLERQWEQHGRRLLAEHRAEEMARSGSALVEMMDRFREWNNNPVLKAFRESVERSSRCVTTLFSPFRTSFVQSAHSANDLHGLLLQSKDGNRHDTDSD
jgi:hypothetical protein